MMRDLRGLTVVVTGASGFIGSRVSSSLAAGGASVFCVSRTAGHPQQADIQWLVGDLTDFETVLGLLEVAKPDAIVHLASKVGGNRALDWVLPTFAANLVSTVNLLTAVAQMRSGRFVLAGSMEEPHPGDLGVPRSPYAASKWAGSGYARMFEALYDVDAVILRIFMTYGPGQLDNSKLVPYVVGSLLRHERPALTGGGRRADWVFVDDVAEAIVGSVIADGVNGETIDIGTGSLTSVREVTERIARFVGGETEIDYGCIPERLREAEDAADPSKARELLGWQSTVSLEKGLERTVDWYREIWNA